MMLQDWDRKYPGRVETIFKAMSNVAPSHLADTELYDFQGLSQDVLSQKAGGDTLFDAPDFTPPQQDDEHDEEATSSNSIQFVNIG